MSLEKMNAIEKRASWSLATVMSLRMLGLFMVLPLFSLYAHQLIDATPLLIGIALGVYGLTQALFQIPFGLLSDKFGRKKIITIGLLLFAVGSVIAALSHSIFTMIIGRALQGTGAVGSTIMAMIADLTRPEQRTKAMAIAGITIGMSFTLSMMIGPLLTNWLTIPGIFWVATGMSAIAILLLFFVVPNSPTPSFHEDTEPDLSKLSSLFFNPLLSRLYTSIFFLHAIFTATFVVVPITLEKYNGLSSHQQWYFYLPVMLLAFIFSILMILQAERKKQLKNYFILGICLLGLAELFWWLNSNNLFLSGISLLLFFTAFSLLEAFLPSLISQSAPPSRKGTALGIYSCSQFLGIFVGGVVGGWLYGQWSVNVVYLFCVIIVLVWVTMTIKMKIGDIHYGKRR